MRRNFFNIVIILLFACFAGALQAVEVNDENYVAYEKPNGAGKDVFLVPKKKILILHGDIAIPIPFIPDLPGYQFNINSAGWKGAVSDFGLNVEELEADSSYSLSTYTINSTDLTSGIAITNDSGYGDYTVTWVDSPGVSLYDIQEQYNGGSWRTVASFLTGVTSYPLTARAEGQYAYRMLVCDYVFSCAERLPINHTVSYTLVPRVPGALQGVTQTDTGMFTLNWDASSPNVGSYIVEQKIGSGDWVTAQYSLEQSIEVNNAEAGTYSFRVKACNAHGCSAYTAVKSVVVSLSNAIISVNPSVSYNGAFTIQWSGAFVANYRKLYERVTGGEWSLISDPVTMLPVSGSMALNRPAGRYEYTVSGFNGFEVTYGPRVAVVDVRVVPLVPSSITGPATSTTGDYTISWQSANTGYYVLQSQQGAGAWVDSDPIYTQSKALVGIADGTYNYRVMACNAHGCSTSSGTHSVVVTGAASGDPATVAAYQLPTGDNNVGAIGSQHEVGNDGSANISIPIPSVDGIGGIQPELSLSYNSNAGNGEVGIGWSISGLSTIHRCGTTLDKDGFVDAVDFDDNDKYCLDGQRLSAIQGDYGAAGTTYATELENFSRVTSLGAEGSRYMLNNSGPPFYSGFGNTDNPQSFVLKTKDGKTIEYGSDDNSRLSRSFSFTECTTPNTSVWACINWNTVTEDRTYQWMIRRVTDKYNNTMEFTYENTDATGEHRISTVTYNGGKNKVVFDYTNRSDETHGFFAGGKLSQTKILEKITSYSATTELRRFNLLYNTGSTGISRLASLEECAGNTGICLEKTLFEWVEGQSGFAIYDFDTSDIGYNYIENKGPLAVDINGDGRDDLLTPAESTWRFALSHGDGFNPWQDTGISTAQSQYTFPFDYNGDGKTDLLMRDGGYWLVLLSSGSGFQYVSTGIPSTGYNKDPRIMDVDGDGRGDLVYVGAGDHWFIRLMTDSGFGNAIDTGAVVKNRTYNLVFDYNGDGLQDLFVPANGVWQAYLSSGSGFQVYYPNLSSQGYDNYPKAMDVNGDGLVDIVSAYNNAWHISLNNGGGFEPAINTGIVPSNTANTRVADIDNDGRDDLLYLSGTATWNGLRSTGDGFEAAVVVTLGISGHGKHSTIMDVKGDGLTGFVIPNSTGIQYNRHLGERPDYLVSMTNGMGVKTGFSYKSLSDDTDVDFYDKGTTPTYPVSSVEDSSFVVDRVEQSDGLGGFHSTNFQYREQRMHMGGAGALGFRKKITINNDTGIKTEATFSQNYQQKQQGMVESVKTIAPGGIVLSHTDNIYETITLNDGDINRHRRVIKKTTRTKNDLNGVFLHKEVNDYSYDDYDNPTLLTSTVYDDAGAILRTTTTSNTYENYLSQGVLGLLTRAEVVTNANGDTHNKITTSDYDATTGRKLNDKVLNPDDDTVVLSQVAYGVDKGGITHLDSFGNSGATTVSGSNFIIRDTKVAFDVTGRYAISKTNALNQTDYFDYYGDNEFSGGAYPGKLKMLTDANGIKTYYRYDAWGRPSQTTKAYGTTAAIETYTRFEWCGDCRDGASYRLITFTQGGKPKITEIDQLGRTLRESTLGLNGQPVQVDYDYDHLGHSVGVTEPYFGGHYAYWNTVEYDILGRAIRTTQADGRVDTIDYNGLTQLATIDVGGKNQTKTEVRNSLGQLVNVQDNDLNTLTYQYDAAGNQTAVNDLSSGESITISYDSLGRKTSMNDPDKGVWYYGYNSLGQLISQKDAKQQVTCNAYDLAGRLVKRIDLYQGGTSQVIGASSDASSQCANDAANTHVAEWIYDTAVGAGVGQLHYVEGEDNYKVTHQYDSLGRAIKTTSNLKGTNYVTDTGYDAFSRPEVLSYPTSSNHMRLSTKNVYNNLGDLVSVVNAANNQSYYDLNAADARGNLIHASLGNGVTTTRDYRSDNGYLESVESFTPAFAANPDVQNLTVAFDAIGNLDHRSDSLAGFSENFTYDSLNRLEHSYSDFGQGVRTHSVTYDAMGNIKTKSGVGSYSYGGSCGGITAGPHAVTGITGTKNATYCYDENGNMLTGDGRTIQYTAFDKPNQIVTSAHTTNMQYGAARELYYRQDINTSGTIDTILLGGLYERRTHSSGKIEERHTIAGTVITTYTKEADTSLTSQTRYLHTDHLGSIVAISDETGQVVERFSFDAWGKRRATNLLDMLEPDNWSLLPAALSSTTTNKGFTGHEQLDGVGLIHMGGRVYDAEIGRFLSADPFVQDRTNLQALNRYGYVLNNPLSYTDPSGYFFKKLFKALKKHLSNINRLMKKIRKTVLQKIARVKWLSTVISIVLNFIPGCQGWCSMLFNAALSHANGGTFASIAKGFVVGAITSGIASSVGGAINGAAGFAAASRAAFAVGAASQAVMSGIVSKAQGGKFIDGFKAAAFSSALTFGIMEYQGEFDQPLPEAKDADGPKGGGKGSNCPINFATGEKYLIIQDYQSSGASRLKFERYYSSLADKETGLGIGWRHNFDKKLQFAGGKETPVSVTAKREQSKSIEFTYLAGEGFSPVPGEFSQLEQTADGWVLALEDNSVERYNQDGELVAIEYLGGYSQTLEYAFVILASGDKARRLTRLTDSFGQLIELVYNDRGLLASMLANGYPVVAYAYDARANLSKVSQSSNPATESVTTPVISYRYQDDRFPHAITSVWDESGQRVHDIAYDDRGRAILSKVDGSGYSVAFVDDNKTTVTYSLGRQHTFVFDKEDRLQAVEGHASTSCLAANQGYRYNDNGQLIAEKDWNDTETLFEYNERGLESRRTLAAGTSQEKVIETLWHPNFRLPVSIDEPGRRIEFSYNDQGLLVERKEIDIQSERSRWQKLFNQYPTRSWQYQYNQRYLLSAVDGPRTDVSDVTTFQYDQQGRRTRVTNALGHSAETLAFNTQGLPTAIRDANNTITRMAYNDRGWLITKALQGPDGEEVTHYQYNGRSRYIGGGKGVASEGLVSAIISADGSKVSYEYDAGGRVLTVINSAGESISYTRDVAGNPISEAVYSSTGDIVRQHTKVFDELSRLLSIVGVDGVRQDYRYDKAGNRIAAIDGLGNETRFAYDALNRLVSTTDALSGEIQQRYDDRDQLVTVEDQRGLVTEYRYNGFGDKIAQISPDTGETLYGYDEAGNLIVKRNANDQVSEYRYDALNRLTAIHYPAANDEDIHYIYDQAAGSELAIGRVAQLIDASGQTTYSYNHRGQVTAKVYRLGEQTYRAETSYNSAGQKIATRYPGGRVVNYQRQRGQLAAMTTASSAAASSTQSVINEISYQAGAMTSVRYGNDLQLIINRDQNARVQQLLVSNAANEAVYDRAYRFDKASNITAIDDRLDAANSEQFAYDPLHRLVNAEGGYGSVEYRFDAVGNRTHRQINTPQAGSEVLEAYRYDDSSNRLLAVASNSDERQLAYDAVGNIIADQRSDENRALIYGANNRLQAVEGDDFGAAYRYNAKGQRVIKRVTQYGGGVEETHFHYGDNDQLVAETLATGEAIREYLYMGTQRVAMVDYRGNWGESGQLVFIHNDHLGTPKVMTDGAGVAVWSSRSLPFGESEVVSAGGVVNPLGFPGQYGDFETGYRYNYFRDYDPSLGRYIQSDPIGLNGGGNTFGYVLGNPMGYIDRYGLSPEDFYAAEEMISNMASKQGWKVPSYTYGDTLSMPFYSKGSTPYLFNFDTNAVSINTYSMEFGISDMFESALSTDQALDLFETYIHETIHANDGLAGQAQNWAQDNLGLGDYHDRIEKMANQLAKEHNEEYQSLRKSMCEVK